MDITQNFRLSRGS